MSETGKPGRYTRSTNGLVAALVVTVVAVLAFVVWRATFRAELEVRPEPYDYLAAAEAAQAAGVDVVYPRDLPEGWMATRVLLRQGERPEWGISLLTEDEKFVGVRQRDDSAEDLVAELVDEHADREDDVEVDGSVAGRWQHWTDEGGDHGFVAELPGSGQTVIVYGSAPEAEQLGLLERLTVGSR
ncbi:DUF4245 family protein [Nocardioides ferulae]|uniref:DUF4245 family protein n=1 Tax=Nocardioides ferulae TaxID=2340821 RepID=UPI0013DDB916|nr:DUF4245 family protein [Nocardioides ferulae]